MLGRSSDWGKMMHMHNGMHTRVAYCVTDLPLLRVRGLLILGPFLDHSEHSTVHFPSLNHCMRGWGRGPARPEQVAAVPYRTGARRTSWPRARREHDAKSREIGSGSSPAWNRRAPRSYRSARADLIHCIPRHHVHAARYREPVAVKRVGRSHRGSSQGTGATLGDSQPGQAGATTADGPRAESTAERDGARSLVRATSHTPLVCKPSSRIHTRAAQGALYYLTLFSI